MSKMMTRSGFQLGDYERPYFVAEVNSSHNGNIDVAKKMIDAAVYAGCNCVKFQSWSAESLYSSSYYKENPISKRILSRFALNRDALKELADYCTYREIDFSSTPYAYDEVDFLVDDCNAPFVKIASMDLNNHRFLQYIAEKNIPIVLSTGMSSIEEVHSAIDTIESAGCSQICLLHCISVYPPKLSTVRLKNIIGLRHEFPKYPVGFSDHSHGIEMAVAATALGAALIEKHLTLDSKKIGMDNQMATEPEEMRAMVRCCLNTQIALGDEQRIVGMAETEQMKKMRRSVIVTRDLPMGHVLEYDDLDAKRPGTGIPVDKIDSVIGKKLIVDKEKDSLLLMDEFE